MGLPISRHLLPLLLTLAAALALLGPLASANASTNDESILQDDTMLIYASPAQVSATLDQLKALGVDRVRVSVYWRLIAPDPTAAKKPSFDATDPASYPAENWARYDTLVTLAKQKGIGVDFNVTSPVPVWASQPGAPSGVEDVYEPTASEFGLFVAAVAKRYSGSYVPPTTAPAPPVTPPPAGAPPPSGNPSPLPFPVFGLGQTSVARLRAGARPDSSALAATDQSGAAAPLPRVDFWEIWNEPNQAGWLSPQWGGDAGNPVPRAAQIYRDLADAAISALGANGHAADTILIGSLAPKGSLTGKGPKDGLSPLRFVRALYCVGDNLRPLSGGAAAALGCPQADQVNAFAAAHPGLFSATGFAHHPYALLTAPAVTAPQPDFVSVADLARLTSTLDKVLSAYGRSRRGGIPIYFTEYGYQTRPPDPLGVSLSKQAAYLAQAEYLAFRNPRVRAVAQFLLQDDEPLPGFAPGSIQYWGSFQTGLQFGPASGKQALPKPSEAGYAIPLFIPGPKVRARHRFRVFAMLRAAPNATSQVAQIQFATRGRQFRTIRSVTTNNAVGDLYPFISVPRRGLIRIAWKNPATSKMLFSNPVAAPIR